MAVLIAVGCGGGASPNRPPLSGAASDDAGAAVVTLESYRADGCACADLACALRVAADRAAWIAGQHGLYTFTDRQGAVAAAANHAFDACDAK